MRTISIIALTGLLGLATVNTTVVPPVTRMTADQAVSTMTAAQLNSFIQEVPSNVLGHRVVGTNPGAGTVLEVGSTVTIFISSGHQ